MKTQDLIGPALDWAVAKCEGAISDDIDDFCLSTPGEYAYSTDWSQGGPIIERGKITLEWTGEDWMGYIWHDAEFFGPTPLVAAMRCYVASVLGDTVEIPEAIAC